MATTDFKLRKRTSKERLDYLYNKLEAGEIDDVGLAHFMFDRMLVEFLKDTGYDEVADRMEHLIYNHFEYTK